MSTTADVAVRERPILFADESVRAILAGRKTQTRRVCGVQPTTAHGLTEKPARWVGGNGRKWFISTVECDWWFGECPYGVPGDRLWVKETWRVGSTDRNTIWYRDNSCLVLADAAENLAGRFLGDRWRSSRFAPRWASRITLEVTGVRVERLQDITHRDALAEGVLYDVSEPDGAPLPRFREAWDSINAKRGHGWDTNPWVWCIEFRQIGAP